MTDPLEGVRMVRDLAYDKLQSGMELRAEQAINLVKMLCDAILTIPSTVGQEVKKQEVEQQGSEQSVEPTTSKKGRVRLDEGK